MHKSKIFLKAMFFIITGIVIYSLSIYFFTVPKIENTIHSLEEKNAREILQKVVILVDEVNNNLKVFESYTLEKHKTELIHLTDTAWSIVQSKYNASKDHRISTNLIKKSHELERALEVIYNQNVNILTEKSLKVLLSNFINAYKYNGGKGSFWLVTENNTITHHDFSPELNGKKLNDFIDIEGTNVGTEIYKKLTSSHHIKVFFYLMNKTSNNKERVVSSIFKFKALNWIIGTQEFQSTLETNLKTELFNQLSKIRYADNNYFFVLDYQKNFLSHPYTKGLNTSQVANSDINDIVDQMIVNARQNGSAFYTYLWSNKNEKQKLKKLSYAKDFPQWQMIISTGFYIDNIEKEVQTRKRAMLTGLRKVIENTQFAASGYLYIFNKKGKMLLHPDKSIEGDENFYQLKNPTKDTNLYDDLVSASKTPSQALYYKWDKPNDKGNYIYDKISWVHYVPELDWYIASSVYVKELQESSNQLKKTIIYSSILMLITSLICAFWFFRKLLTPLNVLSTLISKVSTGDYSARIIDIPKDNEISLLSIEVNNMLDTIESKNLQLNDSNTKLKTMLEDLRNAQKMLIESEKMASLGGLVAGVAHEINTPIGIGLTGITHLDDLTKNIEKSFSNGTMTKNEFLEYLGSLDELNFLIKNNLDKAAHLINSFKQIAVDQTSEEKREFNVYCYLNEILKSINSITRKSNVKIEILCSKEIYITSYPGLFSQIITNLVINSLIHAFNEKEQGTILIKVEIKQHQLFITYSDNGKGIKKEHLNKIFEPFFTTNRKNGGSGLGLNIIYNIVTSMLSGSISCHSEENSGVKFLIKIKL